MSGGRRGSTPFERRPSLKGVLMADTTRGTGRIRSWPRKRGRGGTKVQKRNQQNFMNAQRATKYFAPQMYAWFMRQVEDSPLLPRDAMTMMLYNRLYSFTLDTGKTLWPMPAKLDVSEALDAISQTEGAMLIRGPELWEATEGGGGGGSVKWKKHLDFTITAPLPALIVPDLAQYADVQVIIDRVTSEGSGRRSIQLSTDNAETFWTGIGNYRTYGASGTTANERFIYTHSGSSEGVRSSSTMITGLNIGGAVTANVISGGGATALFAGSEDPVTGLRVLGATGGAMTGGRIIVLGR